MRVRIGDLNQASSGGVGLEPPSRLTTANGFRDRPVQPLRDSDKRNQGCDRCGEHPDRDRVDDLEAAALQSSASIE